jgi:mycothiol system anti-sigma-R factor
MSSQQGQENMDCEEAIHRLYHFLDGELTEERRVEIRRHLDECRPCLQAFDFEAELLHLLAAKCRDHVPEGLRRRVAEAIDHEQRAAGGPPDRG